jgi:hypothetical protein
MIRRRKMKNLSKFLYALGIGGLIANSVGIAVIFMTIVFGKGYIVIQESNSIIAIIELIFAYYIIGFVAYIAALKEKC